MDPYFQKLSLINYKWFRSWFELKKIWFDIADNIEFFRINILRYSPRSYFRMFHAEKSNNRNVKVWKDMEMAN